VTGVQTCALPISLRAGQGVYYTRDKKIVVSGSPVIEMKRSGTTASADVMTIYTEEDYIIMTGNVVIKSSNYTLTSDKATYYQSTGTFKLSGRASSPMNDTILTADRIDIITVNNQLKSYSAIGNVEAVNTNDGFTIYSGRLDYYKELGYARITENPVIVFHDQNMRAYSKVMDQYENEKKANLIGNVIIEQGDQRAYAHWGEYFSDQKIMNLSGNPILASGESKMNANRIMVDVSAGEMTMIGGGTGYYRYDSGN
jgi:lipopolysaccharide export system protein LptA